MSGAGGAMTQRHSKEARQHRTGRWIFVGWSALSFVLWLIFGQVISLLLIPFFLLQAGLEHRWMRAYERMGR